MRSEIINAVVRRIFTVVFIGFFGFARAPARDMQIAVHVNVETDKHGGYQNQIKQHISTQLSQKIMFQPKFCVFFVL